jgi:hypothetical protein
MQPARKVAETSGHVSPRSVALTAATASAQAAV